LASTPFNRATFIPFIFHPIFSPICNTCELSQSQIAHKLSHNLLFSSFFRYLIGNLLVKNLMAFSSSSCTSYELLFLNLQGTIVNQVAYPLKQLFDEK